MAVNVRIISLDAHVKRAATHPVRVVFPDAAFFPAVDFRKTSADDLLSEGLVTFAGYEAIKNGRKYHHELSTPGAVGLSLSYYNIAREFASKRSPVLVCEDDCLPHKDVPEVVAQLLQHQSRFDVAVLGSFGHVHGTKIAPCEFEGFGELKGGYFWGMHCVLFSRGGIEKFARLAAPPVDCQLDAHVSRLAARGEMRVLLQEDGCPPLATQKAHVSTIQTKGGCTMCDLEPRAALGFDYRLVWVLLIVCVLYIFVMHSCCVKVW